MSIEKSTVEEIRLVLGYMSKGYEVPKIVYDQVMATAKREIEGKNRVVLIKRDPDVARSRMQAVYAKITDSPSGKYDYILEVHPATVGGFGADFDGDTMAVYVPLSEQAQAQAKEKMITATDASSINAPNFKLSNEMLTGLFTLTYLESGEYKQISDISKVVDLDIAQKIKIKYKGELRKTSVGKIIFNEALPKWYPFIDFAVNKKNLGVIMSDIISKNQKDFVKTIDDLMRTAFYYGTIYPKSFALDMLDLSPELIELKGKLEKTNDVSEQSTILDEMEVALMNQLKENVPQLYTQLQAGATKGLSQIRQVMVCKGIVADPSGNILPPIMSSISQGYKPNEYFEAAAGSRKGIIDRAINTASGGYSYRKMIYIVGNVTLNEKIKNCRTRKGLRFKLTDKLYSKLNGRYVIGKDSDDIIPINEKMIGDIITLRSPIFCKTNAICPICYGELAKQIKTVNIGIVSAQTMNISEKIMKCACGLVEKEDGRYYSMDDIWEGTSWSDD